MALPEKQQQWVLSGYDLCIKEPATEAVMASPSE